MSIQFVWEEKFSVGDSKIDEQHKSLFELGNNLAEVSNESDIRRDIMHLYKYIREHFKTEEGMMKRIGFPLFEEHKMFHDELITKLNQISSSPLNTDDAIYGFKKFVFEWLIDHIMVQDNKYFRFAQTRK